eukprot:CAMPEP_0168316970 /NCGR_PEP_ID=MMETSP0210-20121227/21274_1 /TAXON_ID=40633 /ORGANISM="Condylostoma magnum, Strain COL2" /LENGTH=43 /DNA_ID= /DNA_START= /DNA_END= /DNA_ORIENTATION=
MQQEYLAKNSALMNYRILQAKEKANSLIQQKKEKMIRKSKSAE